MNRARKERRMIVRTGVGAQCFFASWSTRHFYRRRVIDEESDGTKLVRVD